jgi:hypothetical protein
VFVFVDREKVEQMAGVLASNDLPAPDWRFPPFLVDDKWFVELASVACAIDFCFFNPTAHGCFDVEYPEGSEVIYSGFSAVFACLTRAYDEGIDVHRPHFLRDISAEHWGDIFRHKTIPIPMLEKRMMHLRDVGHVLADILRCDFYDLFEDADFRLFGLNKPDGLLEQLLFHFQCYRDTQLLPNGHPLHFHQRAQRLAMMYHGRALSSGGILPPLRDPQKLGPIANQQMSKVLRALKILHYTKELAWKIDAGIALSSGSRMELEIRAQTVCVLCDLLAGINALRSVDRQITMTELDYALWSASYATERWPHYTLTTAD